MLITVIFCVVMFFMWLALVATYGIGAIQNGIYTLGITLPEEAQKDVEVQAILHDYKVKKRVLHLIGFLTIGLSIPMADWSSILIVYIFVWFFVLYYVYTKVLKKHSWKLYELKKTRGWLNLTQAEKEAGKTNDDDFYWLTNQKNPNVKSVTQEKRVGFGIELNTSNKANIVIIVVTFLFVFSLAVFLLKFDLAHVTMEKDKDMVTIEAADMGETFFLQSVQDVKLLDKYPSMSKKHGYNGGKYNLGTFNVSGVGTCEVYMNIKNEMVIQIKTDQSTIIFNMDSEEETEEAYKELQQWLKEAKVKE